MMTHAQNNLAESAPAQSTETAAASEASAAQTGAATQVSQTQMQAAEGGAVQHAQAIAPSAEAVRAEAAEVAQVCAQAARLGLQIDAADAVAKGVKPDALRAKVLADLAARSDAAGIIATAPVATTSESPIVAAAKKTAAGTR